MSLMGAGREYVLKIIADTKDAQKGVEDVANKTTSMKDKMIGVGKAVATGMAATAVVDFGKDCINAAADADDAMDAINAAFGTSAKEIANFSKSSAENMGQSTAEYQTMAAKTGNLLQSMGISSDQAAKSTEVLSQRAADMAAIWGTDTATAMEAINKGLAGSTKSLQQFGVKLSKSEIDARAMAKGYTDASGKVTDAGRAIAAQELILEKTSNVQGAWAENSKDLGSQQDILKAKMANLQAELGGKLLPIVVKLMEMAQPILNFIMANVNWLAPLAGIIAGVVAAIKVWTVVQWALNAALTANPIGLIVAAIAAVIAAIVLLYTKVGWFRDAVDAAIDGIVAAFNWLKDAVVAVFDWVKEHWPLLLAIITGPIGAAVILITKNWDTIKEGFSAVIDFIKQVMSTVWEILTAPYRMAIDAVKKMIDEVPTAFRNAVSGITTALSTVWDVISAPFKKGWDLAKQAGQTVMDWFGGIYGKMQTAFRGLEEVIKAPFKAAVDAIKSLWNNTIGKISFTVPSWVPGIGGKGFSFPKMAKGGIVNRPTIALIGEAGPEAVVPLDRLAQVNPEPTQVTNITIQVYALEATAATGRRIYDALRDYSRVSGNQIVVN